MLSRPPRGVFVGLVVLLTVVIVARDDGVERSGRADASGGSADGGVARIPPTARAMRAGAPCTQEARLDQSGTSDVTPALQAAVDASRPGSVICLEAGARYRMDGTLHLAARSDLIIDGKGAMLTATVRSAAPMILIDNGGSGIAIRDLGIEGVKQAGTADLHDPDHQGNHGIAIGGTSNVEIGPAVTIRDVAGDGVYVTGGRGPSGTRWAERIRIHDSTIRSIGRMGIAITDGARDVVVEFTELADVALYAFDIEPNGAIVEGVPAGADDVRFSDNSIRGYGLSAALEPWLFAAAGVGPERDIEFSRNAVVGRPMLIGVWDVEGSLRSNFRIIDNWSDTPAIGPTMVFEGVDGLTVSGNVQPLLDGTLVSHRRSTLTIPID